MSAKAVVIVTLAIIPALFLLPFPANPVDLGFERVEFVVRPRAR